MSVTSMRGLLVFITVFILLSACAEEDVLITEDQPVYFEYVYSNMAWAYQFNGWLIDGEGNVRSFNLPEDWQSNEDGRLTKEELEYNIQQTDSIIADVDPGILEKKVQLIHDAVGGAVSGPEYIAADAGASVLYAYYWDDEDRIYRQLFLAQSGDVESHNESQAAVKLTEWLREFPVFWLD